MKKLKIALFVFWGLALVAFATAAGPSIHYTSLPNYEPINENYAIAASIAPDENLTEETDSPEGDIQALEDLLAANLGGETISDENVFNVLLIGSDERPGGSRGRSDTMMLVSLNSNTKQIVMTSFLRDIYLTIPEVGNNRLNAAYAFGGAPLLIDTLEENFGVGIDRYIRIDFTAFTDAIDILGGVTMELSDGEADYINEEMDAANQLAGTGNTFTLNGAQALTYARIRYLDSDFGRTERQRKLITEIFGEMKSVGILELNNLLNELLPQVTTDLTQTELLSLIASSISYFNYELVSSYIPADGSYSFLTIDQMSVLGIDFMANRTTLVTTIYGG